MRRTMFDTPVLKTVLRLISLFLLKITGWKVIGERPDVSKYVVIAAPHTSNWDMPVMLFVAFALKIKVFWIGKESLFKKPFGRIMRFMGGIPIDRSKANNTVDQSINLFKENESMVLIVPPKGSRSKAVSWKTGFYYIAYGAKVPIYLCFMDWGRKESGIGPILYPTGDIESDMVFIRDFYLNKKGKNNDQKTEASVILKERNKKCS